jgi:hypothetical protein
MSKFNTLEVRGNKKSNKLVVRIEHLSGRLWLPLYDEVTLSSSEKLATRTEKSSGQNY